MKFKTKSRLCTGIVALALAITFIYSNAFAASETKTVQCGESNFAIITATISLGDKGVVEKNKYLYTYCATLRGTYCDAATNAKVVISGGVTDELNLSKQHVYPVVSGTCGTGLITAKASMDGYSSKSITINKESK